MRVSTPLENLVSFTMLIYSCEAQIMRVQVYQGHLGCSCRSINTVCASTGSLSLPPPHEFLTILMNQPLISHLHHLRASTLVLLPRSGRS